MKTKFNIGDTVATIYDKDNFAKIVSIDTHTANIPIYEMRYENGNWCVNFEQDIVLAVAPQEVMENGQCIIKQTFQEVFGYKDKSYTPEAVTMIYKYKDTFYYICLADGIVDCFKELR